MDLDTLLNRIKNKIQDPSYDPDSDLVPLINQGLGEIATMIALPALTTVTTIECGTGPSVDLPDDFHANVHHAFNQTKDGHVQIIKSLPDFIEEFPGLNGEGSVTHICVHGRKLYFQDASGSSSPETLLITYTSRPTLFDRSGGVTKIDYIPHEMQAPLLVNYAVREVFGEIEDGVEGMKVNWNTHNKLFNEAFAKLQAFLGVQPGTPAFVKQSGSGRGIFRRNVSDIDDELI